MSKQEKAEEKRALLIGRIIHETRVKGLKAGRSFNQGSFYLALVFASMHDLKAIAKMVGVE
jgi:CRISPR/Cas system-associated exonuclease Cas4 (RecB family)